MSTTTGEVENPWQALVKLCVGVCIWEPTHSGRVVAHGLLLCKVCERPLTCIEHDGHGALLANGYGVDLEVIKDGRNGPSAAR